MVDVADMDKLVGRYSKKQGEALTLTEACPIGGDIARIYSWLSHQTPRREHMTIRENTGISREIQDRRSGWNGLHHRLNLETGGHFQPRDSLSITFSTITTTTA